MTFVFVQCLDSARQGVVRKRIQLAHNALPAASVGHDARIFAKIVEQACDETATDVARFAQQWMSATGAFPFQRAIDEQRVRHLSARKDLGVLKHLGQPLETLLLETIHDELVRREHAQVVVEEADDFLVRNLAQFSEP